MIETVNICKICNSDAEFAFENQLMFKYNVKYYHCPNCDLIFTEEPYWLEEAYVNAINQSDTGILIRNIQQVICTSALCFFVIGKRKQYLDYGAGTGLFVRAMRDVGFDFYYYDKFPTNIFARGLEPTNEVFDLVTSFETFEHFENPIQEIESLLKLTDSILFSTLLHKTGIVPDKDWWYYGFDHGQHVVFYSNKTIKYIAEKFNLHLISNKTTTHLLTRKKVNKYILKFLQNKVFCTLIFPFIKLFLKSKN